MWLNNVLILLLKILGIKYVGASVDVWSSGIVLYLMLAGKFPFDNVQQVLHEVFPNPPNVSAGKEFSHNILKQPLTLCQNVVNYCI